MKRKRGKIDSPHFVNFNVLHEKWMQDPEYRREYDALEAEFELIHAMIDARLTRGITQKELAERMGISQSALARLETGNGNPSFKFLKRVADALGMKLKISFV